MAKRANLFIDQGSEFETTFVVYEANGSPKDLTSFQAFSHIRKTPTSQNFVEFFCDTTANGEVILSLPSFQSSELYPGKYVYDCELIDSLGKKERIREGLIEISPNITRY